MDEVERLALAALWYAWGRIDAGEFPGMDLDAGYAFSKWYRELAERYDSGKTYYRPSLLSEWARFSTAGRVQVS